MSHAEKMALFEERKKDQTGYGRAGKIQGP